MRLILFDEAEEHLRHIAARRRAPHLGLLIAELDGIAGDVRALVGELDPNPIIDELDTLVGEVRAAVDAIKPSELLAELERPLGDRRCVSSGSAE
jgi:hypothetical protein